MASPRTARLIFEFLIKLNVIDEHFLIFFLAPSADPAVTDPAYLAGVAEQLDRCGQALADHFQHAHAPFDCVQLQSAQFGNPQAGGI